MFNNFFVQISVSTGACPFNRQNSSSLDPFIESSFSIEPNVSSPSNTYINRNQELDQSAESSYLVIGEEVRKEEEYANYQTEDNVVNKSKIISTGAEKNSFVSPSMNSQMRSDKPETSSNSMTFTVATSVSSSSSSALSSTAHLPPVSVDCDLKSPSSLHDSTISRLIDAVSLGNEQDTCGSISALIGQFESTVDHNDLITLSHDHTPAHHSDFRPTTPRSLQDLRSPLRTIAESTDKKHPISPQKVAPETNTVKHEILSQADGHAPAVFSSPETTELEEVYTILDEEVLLPVSVYNLKKQMVHVQADILESTPSNSTESSPMKSVQGLKEGQNLGWDDVHRLRGRSKQMKEVEESVYEEVYDPPAPVPKIEGDSSIRYMGSSVNKDCFQFLHDSTGDTFAEVELNVDEDPLEIMLASPRHSSQWEGLTSPTKRHAIYQNHESTPNFSQQKRPSSYHDPQTQYPSNASHVAFTQCPSPINKPSYQFSSHHQHQNNSQPSPFHRLNSRPSNPSPLHQKDYHIPQSNSEAFKSSRDLSSSYTQQVSYCDSQILNRSHPERLGYKQMERVQTKYFHNGFSSSESLNGQSAVSKNISRDRGLYSPSSDSDAVYSHMNYDCITPSLESSAPQKTQQNCQSKTQPVTQKQSWNQKLSLNSTWHQSQPETRVPRQTKPTTTDSSGPSSCKSKSLGDLTSEDISCNFQSKYHIISRSFITPHMRKQKRMGTMGELTFQSQSSDPLIEQLRKLVTLEGDDSDRDRSQPPHLRQELKSVQPQITSVAPVVTRDADDSPSPLTRRLSSRSQSRVRHINSRARERQQEALKPRASVVINNAASIGGVVLRNKPASRNPSVNRHSTGSYIAGYIGQLEDRGLPEGACTSLRYGHGDHYGDRYYTDDSLPSADPNHSASEPEVYFLLRL